MLRKKVSFRYQKVTNRLKKIGIRLTNFGICFARVIISFARVGFRFAKIYLRHEKIEIRHLRMAFFSICRWFKPPAKEQAPLMGLHFLAEGFIPPWGRAVVLSLCSVR